jgi:hypothetical protein
MLIILVLMVAVWTVRSNGSGLGMRGGEVLPPTAKSKGYSLSDMARATAFFNTGPRTLDTYPKTPFQILTPRPTHSKLIRTLFSTCHSFTMMTPRQLSESFQMSVSGTQS